MIVEVQVVEKGRSSPSRPSLSFPPNLRSTHCPRLATLLPSQVHISHSNQHYQNQSANSQSPNILFLKKKNVLLPPNRLLDQVLCDKSGSSCSRKDPLCISLSVLSSETKLTHHSPIQNSSSASLSTHTHTLSLRFTLLASTSTNLSLLCLLSLSLFFHLDQLATRTSMERLSESTEPTITTLIPTSSITMPKSQSITLESQTSSMLIDPLQLLGPLNHLVRNFSCSRTTPNSFTNSRVLSSWISSSS